MIEWWESRRWLFNVVVGCTGLVTCVAMITCALIAEQTVGEPIGLPDPAYLGIFGIVLFGILANICYTGGWIVELVLSRLRGRASTTAFGLKAFRFGLTISVFVTLCPSILSWLVFLFALFRGQRHTAAD